MFLDVLCTDTYYCDFYFQFCLSFLKKTQDTILPPPYVMAVDTGGLIKTFQVLLGSLTSVFKRFLPIAYTQDLSTFVKLIIFGYRLIVHYLMIFHDLLIFCYRLDL